MQAARMFPLTAALLLAGCHDFTGALGRLGFVSNLRLSHAAPWTPDHPVAAGVFAEIMASERLTGSADPDQPPEVQGAAGGGLIAAMPSIDGAQVAFTGDDGDTGVVRFWGEVDDHFRVRFARAEEAVLIHPMDAYFGMPPADRVALVAGEDVVVDVALLGADGGALGWPRDDLHVVGQGGVSAWMEGEALHLVADADGSVHVRVDGVGAWVVPVEAVSPDVDAEVEVLRATVEEERAAMAVRWLGDGTRLLGAPVDWPHTEENTDVVLAP